MIIQKENRNEIHTLNESDLKEYRLAAEEIGYYKALNTVNAYIAMLKYSTTISSREMALQDLQDFIKSLGLHKIRGEFE